MYIKEIFQLDELLNEEKKVVNETGINITNISNWNTSAAYKNFMFKNIILKHNENIFDYIYSYDFDKSIREQILKKLGIQNEKQCMCLITPSSTISILNIINYLKHNGFKKMCIIDPAYFSIEQCCITLNFQYERKSLLYKDGKYTIPEEYILKNKFDAIWITSPIYSSGILFDDTQINIIKKIIDSRILVIADETLALSGQELCRKIPISSYFFSIYCPHKSLFVNNIKFSVIACPISNDDFFEQWIDVLGGALLGSNITAVFHFLSDNFEYCTMKSIKWFNNSLSALKNILIQFSNVYCDTQNISSYKMVVFNNNVKYNINNTKNIIKIINNRFVSYIPGIYHGYSNIHENCFRINMSIDSNDIQMGLYNILSNYL